MPASIKFNKLPLNRGKGRGMAEVTLHPLNHRRELPFSKHLQEQTDTSPATNPRRVMKNRKEKKKAKEKLKMLLTWDPAEP